MRLTRRRSYEVACNWKPFIEVFMEEHHLHVVYPSSIGGTYEKGTFPAPGAGQYVSIFAPHDGTGALRSNERDQACPPISTLSGRTERGSLYVLVYPSLIFCCTVDCM